MRSRHRRGRSWALGGYPPTSVLAGRKSVKIADMYRFALLAGLLEPYDYSYNSDKHPKMCSTTAYNQKWHKISSVLTKRKSKNTPVPSFMECRFLPVNRSGAVSLSVPPAFDQTLQWDPLRKQTAIACPERCAHPHTVLGSSIPEPHWIHTSFVRSYGHPVPHRRAG